MFENCVKTIITYSLLYDEVQLTLTQIKVVQNSGSITALSNSFEDYEALMTKLFFDPTSADPLQMLDPICSVECAC